MQKFIQCVNNSNSNDSVIDTIHAIKKAGFDGVFLQWYNRDLEFSQEEQLKLCRELNLEIPFVHLSYKDINNMWLDNEIGDTLVINYLHDLDVCKQNNINMVVIHLNSKYNPPEKNILGLKRFQTIINHAEKLGIKVAIENTKTPGYLEFIFENTKNKNVGICFDSGHCHCHFNDEFNWEMFKNKIFALHLHDNDKSGDQHLLPFDGTINWDLYSKNLDYANYTGPIILESCYKDKYTEMSIDDFYKLSLERAKIIAKKMN